MPNRLLSYFNFSGEKNLFHVHIKGYRYPLWARYGTSDSETFNDIFVEQGYACLNDIKNPKLIMDCGAYVGYSTVWFLNKYPDACVIAIEPCTRNFAVCQRNLRPYGKRVSLIHSAVWSHRTGLVVCRGGV